jgi:RNA polymerase-binding transcription factor DksA
MPLDSMQIEEIRRLLQKKKQDLTDATAGAKKKPAVKKAVKKKKKPSPVEASLASELREVDAALKRIKEQETRFGYCERCFMEIPWRELAVNPARRFCSRCV